MKILLYESAYTSGADAVSHEFEWPDFKKLLSEPEIVSDKRQATQYFPGEMLPGTSSKRESDVDRIHLYCLDADGISKSDFELLCELVKAERLEGVIHSTWRHSEALRETGLYRVRGVFPLKRPVLRGEWPLFWASARLMLGKFADPTTSNAQKHYLWSAHPPKCEADFIWREFSGDVLDPDELLGRYGIGPLSEANAEQQLGTTPLSRAKLLEFVQTSKSKRVAKIRDALESALSGDQYALEGNREKTLFDIARVLAWRYPTVRLSDLAEPFRPSVEQEHEHGGPSFQDFTDKLRRAQLFELSEHSSKQVSEHVKEAKLAKLKAESQIFTPETLDAYISQAEGRVTVQDLGQQLLLAKGQQIWAFYGDGYRTCSRMDAGHVVAETLEFRAEDLFDFHVHNPPSGDGPPKRKSVDQLLLEYGSVVDHIEYNYEGRTYFDKTTHTLKQSYLSANARPVPERDAQVEKYIESLARNSKEHERLLDYLSLVPNLSRPLVILLLEGVKGSGKTAMAYMLSQVFGCQSPVAMSAAFGSFNADLLRCPVLLADEGLPEINGRVPTDLIRSMISEPVHHINQKFQAPATLRGYYRVVVAMNSLSNLKFGRSAHSKEDMEAIADRFLIVNVTAKSRDLFRPTHFINDGAFSRHVMWLAKNHQRVTDDLRFGVDTSDSYKHILAADIHTEDLFAWLIEYLLAHIKKSVELPSPNLKAAAFVHRGYVYVNTDAVLRSWQQYSTRLRQPSSAKALVTAVRAVAEEKEVLRMAIGQVLYWKVKLEPFRHFISASDVMPEAAFDLLMKVQHEQHFTGKHQLTDEERVARALALKELLPEQEIKTLKPKFLVEKSVFETGPAS